MLKKEKFFALHQVTPSRFVGINSKPCLSSLSANKALISLLNLIQMVYIYTFV